MVRLFNHWFASNTLMQVAFDVLLLFLSVVLAVAFLNQGDVTSLFAVVPDALLFAFTMVALNTVVGLYQRNPGRTFAQTTARIVLSLMLAVPVAWAIFTYLPRTEAWNDTLRLAVPVAFVTFVAIRGIVVHSGISPLFARRTLVLGIGAEAVAVEQSIGHVGQAIRFLGFYPAKKSETPHLVVRIHDSLYEAARDRIERMAKQAGFEGRLVILAEPDIATGDCRIEWADGGVVLERAAIEAKISELVGRYLASATTPA